MTLANLYLVGAPKCGTTSLAAWLAQHPDVFWSTPKEPFHWAADFPGHRRHYGFDSRTHYERLYDDAGSARWRGDGSTTYLYSEVAVPAILEEVPDARFLVCLRDPVPLIVSYHRTQLTALNEDETAFDRAWARSMRGELPGTDPIEPFLVDYPRVGRLGVAYERLARLVPAERLHVVLFDDLHRDPVGTHARVLDFLDLPPHEVDLTARNASTKAARFEALTRFGHRPPAALAPAVTRVRQWSRQTSVPGVAQLKRTLWKSAERPEVNDATLAGLRAYFDDDVALLEQALGHPLPGWRNRVG